MIKYAVAALAATVAATPAFAQDATPSFTGGHIEVIAGADGASAEGNGERGAVYGLAGGFDFQTGAFVAGVEAEAAESSTKICEEGICAEARRDFYVGGRVGTVVGGSTLLYVKGGYTNFRVVASDGDESIGQNLDGLRAGIGAEANVGSILVKLEYRYSNYELDVSRHQAVVGLGVRF